jgi:hypothetical protein
MRVTAVCLIILCGRVAAFAADHTPEDGAALAAILQTAQCGDTISLTPGVSYIGSFTLAARGCTAGTPITIRTVPNPNLPEPGIRTGPAYAPYLAILRSTSTNFAVISTTKNADGWTLENLWIYDTSTGGHTGAMVNLGSHLETVADDQPTGLVVDRVLLQGAVGTLAHRGIALNSRDTTIKNSYLNGFKGEGIETQAIASWNGPGPFLIENNYLEAAGIGVLFGGANPAIVGLIPANITIRRNYITKRLEWHPQHPSYDGSKWTIKNALEFKKGRAILIEKNVLEHVWVQAQTGVALLLTPCNSGTDPTAEIRDVVVRDNVIRSAASVMAISPSCGLPTAGGSNIHVEHNLAYDIGAGLWSTVERYLIFPLNSSFPYVQFVQNTFIGTYSARGVIAFSGPPDAIGFVFQGNIIRHGTYGLKGDGQGTGNSTLDYYTQAAVVTGNLFGYSGPNPANWYSSYPGNTFIADAVLDEQFMDLSNQDFRLRATSPYLGYGVDFARLEGAGGGEVPSPGPPEDERWQQLLELIDRARQIIEDLRP